MFDCLRVQAEQLFCPQRRCRTFCLGRVLEYTPVGKKSCALLRPKLAYSIRPRKQQQPHRCACAAFRERKAKHALLCLFFNAAELVCLKDRADCLASTLWYARNFCGAGLGGAASPKGVRSPGGDRREGKARTAAPQGYATRPSLKEQRSRLQAWRAGVQRGRAHGPSAPAGGGGIQSSNRLQIKRVGFRLKQKRNTTNPPSCNRPGEGHETLVQS